MSLTDHAAWPELAHFIHVETYDRDGGHRHPRHRLEVETPKNGTLVRHFLGLTMPCVACGQTIHPVRQRQSKALHLYLAVTCPLNESYACARSKFAADEYKRIVNKLTKP